jgi:DNA-binding transcriptional LysR family regulator
MNEPDWDLYRSFLAVLRSGSLSAAARELGLTQPTLGRHIDTLEGALGFALFVRSRHGFLPTEQALALQPYAEALAAGAAALLRAASGSAEGVRGAVRITASEVVGCELLPPILARLHADYPALQIELALSNRTQDLLRREADIAVRMLPPSQEALVATRVGSVEVALHAHPDYLARRGVPASAADLAGHTLIGFDSDNAFIRKAAEQLGGVQRAMFHLRADSDLAQLAAIRAGVGIGACQSRIAARDGLVRVLPEAAFRLDTWVAMHEDLRSSRRCTVVFGALADGLRAWLN